MPKLSTIEKILINWPFLSALGYRLTKKETISGLEAGHRNYLGLNFKNDSRELCFSFFEYYYDKQVDQFSLLVKSLVCRSARFGTFSMDDYFRKKNTPEKMKCLSFNHYPEISLEEQTRAVLAFFEQQLSDPELASMVRGDTWLEGYYTFSPV